jgi:hypothetical protein
MSTATKYPVLEVTEDTTAQEIFDAVAKHLLAQGEKSEAPVVGTNGELVCNAMSCRYRAGNLACAVGCLLTDDEARYNEGRNVYGAEFNVALDRHLHLLDHLQKTHDHTPVEDWREKLRALAQACGLSAAVLA